MKKKQSREYGAFNARIFLAFILCSIGASLAIAAVVTELVPGTAVLLNQSGSSGGGNGGNATSTSSSTNIFSPAAFVDYKRFGGEPTVVDDRQWVEADETAPLPAGNTGNVYISAINLADPALPTLTVLRSTHDAAALSFNSDSTCTTATYTTGGGTAFGPGADNVATPC